MAPALGGGGGEALEASRPSWEARAKPGYSFRGPWVPGPAVLQGAGLLSSPVKCELV